MAGRGVINISGVSDSQTAPLAAGIINEKKGQYLLVVSSFVRAKRLAEDLSFFADRNICVLPEEEEFFLPYEARDHGALQKRLKVLKSIEQDPDCVVIAPVSAAVRKMPPEDSFRGKSVEIKVGDDIEQSDLIRDLTQMGYERLPVIDGRGQFAVRGGIIDIFPPDAERPVRTELFDTEVDSVRSFDMDTQRSIENLGGISIWPAEQMTRDEEAFERALSAIEKAYDKQIKKLKKKEGSREALENLEEKKESLTDYIKENINIPQLENYIGYFYDSPETIRDYMDDPVIMIDDPNETLKHIENTTQSMLDDFALMLEKGKAVPEDRNSFPSADDYLDLYIPKNDDVYIFTPFASRVRHIDSFAEVINVQGRQTPAFAGRLDVFEKELQAYLSKGYQVTMVCPGSDRVENMRQFLGGKSLYDSVRVEDGHLSAGIDLPDRKQCWIRDEDVFSIKKKQKRRRKRFSGGSPLKSFSDISKGDFVVHESYGIGKFLGIEQVTIQGVRSDYLKIKYSGTSMLYVPVDNMDVIQKYVGADNASPKLSNLSGAEWKVTKAKAKAAIAHMAEELLETSAARKIEKGYSFSPDSEWQGRFEADFPYTETDDQLRAVEEIKSDMESSRPMDRLLCGDVGFGKTEVAARAVFKCLAEGRQAAMLVPTTILANQHYYTLKERFEKFPFKVEVLSRFRSPAQQEKTVEKLRSGEVDFVIGTHRLLSGDVKFSDLGLLVVDEEQRFGVQHKEKIKQMKHNVDVLTLSATPIPRTLHMSLSGIRDMSLIEEPPEDRYPVQTYVAEQDDEMIREAIRRETERGGQVYVIFNRVRGISQIASRIRKLLPDLEVATAHGQMNEEKLENVLMDFVDGNIDVLVATTIIESGMDIPNVNTMIVMDADRYGLSQLYQLRGRVGRSNRIAYAYLMYQKDKVLTELSAGRLKAIKEFTEFGAGFRIAMRDMEMRGAGNLLGTEQHGHMLKIGYELYFKLVDSAVRKLKGEETAPEDEGPVIELGVPAYIPDRYISDEILKIQMYKKIAEIEGKEDEEDVTDELIDRFGDIPEETRSLIMVSRIRSLASRNRFDRISMKNGRVYFHAEEGGGPGPEGMALAAAELGVRLFIHGGVEPEIRYTPEKGDLLPQVIHVLEAFLPESAK